LQNRKDGAPKIQSHVFDPSKSTPLLEPTIR
jgi:hypothetical protein